MTKSTQQNFAEGEHVMYHSYNGWYPAVVLNPHTVPNRHGTLQLKLRVVGGEYDFRGVSTFDTTCINSRAKVLKMDEFNEKIKPELDRQAAEKQLDDEAEDRRRHWYAEAIHDTSRALHDRSDRVEAIAAQLAVWYPVEHIVAYNAYYRAHPEEERR